MKSRKIGVIKIIRSLRRRILDTLDSSFKGISKRKWAHIFVNLYFSMGIIMAVIAIVMFLVHNPQAEFILNLANIFIQIAEIIKA